MARKKREIITDKRQLEAAQILAFNGYKKGAHKRTGAVPAAARQAGVTVDMIYQWMKDKNFVTCVEEMKATLLTTAIVNLKKLAQKGNATACIFLAKVLAPELYDDQLRRQQLANEGLLEAVKELPPLRIIATGELPATPPELLPYLETIETTATKQ